LLEAIGRTGSITLAAQDLNMSYRAAWDAVQMLNNLFPKPLVRARPGGRSGGVAGLTPEGQTALATLRHVQSEIAITMERLGQRLAADSLPDLGLDSWRLAMRTSARNALRGVVNRLTPGVVVCQVGLKIEDGLELTAAISRRSVEILGLTEGSTAIALVKASLVTLSKTAAPSPRLGLNEIPGVVIAHESGANTCEVVLEIQDGKTLTATLTREQDKALNLALGDDALATIEAAHVILAVD
jgi:molybdate transport system regulatory protein